MTTDQEDRLSMYISSISYLNANAEITNGLPEFSTNYAAFKETILKIQQFSQVQKTDQSGNTKGKNQAKKLLIALTEDNARKLTSFATLTSNPVLLSKVKISGTKLKRASDTGLKDYAQIVYDQAQPIVESLLNYGITADTQKTLLDAITAYEATIPAPRMGTTEISQATKQLVVLFEAADKYLEKIDSAIDIIKLKQPNFYNGYKSARKIIRTSAGSIAVKGLVTDTNGNPLKAVTIKFTTDGAVNNTVAIKKTAAKGGFRIKSMVPGMYKVTATKTGYAEQVLTFAVTEGELNVLEIMLAKK